MKRRIRLTEAQLQNLVARATSSVLNEIDAMGQGTALDANGRPILNRPRQ